LRENSNPRHLFRFGIFELDGESGELRKEGKVRPRLQGQPLEVLLQLVDRPGELVTREALRQRLWPADTFVDYDHSLNAAVNKLREALGDSAENPRFIQTIPKRGYRFISPVEKPSLPVPVRRSEPDSMSSAPGLRPPDPTIHGVENPSPRATILSDRDELPSIPSTVVRALFAPIQVMYLCFYIAFLADLSRVQTVIGMLFPFPHLLFLLFLGTGLIGIPIRLYLLTASLFGYSGLNRRFLTLFPVLFPLDALWALAPFFLISRIGLGLVLAATAALVYVPFAQRSLLLMSKSKS
jgi:cholera toxin transcriptional activator